MFYENNDGVFVWNLFLPGNQLKAKIMKRELFLSFFLIIFLISAARGADSPNPRIWEPLGNHFYYNKKIITKAPGFYLIWTYKTVSDEVRAKTMEDVKSYDPAKSEKYRDYHHATVLWAVDCHQKLIRTEEFIDFDRNGKVIDRLRSDPSPWVRIISKTGGDRLYQKACLPPQETVKKKKSR